MFIHFSDMNADYVYNAKYIYSIIRKPNTDYFTITFTDDTMKTFKFDGSKIARETYFDILKRLQGIF